MGYGRFIGIGVLALAAFVYLKGKGSSALSQSDPLEEVEIRNLQLKETSLQNILEDEPQRISTLISNSQRTISFLMDEISKVRGKNATDIFVSSRARNQDRILRGNLNEETSRLEGLKAEQGIILDRATQTIFEQETYGQDTLADIRQNLLDRGASF